MKHPGGETLALLAGGELGFLDRWFQRRHVSGCESCQREIEAFSDLRSAASELSELPEVGWGRLAAEMRANIRLGLAAGQCVRKEPASHEPRFLPAPRSLVACASLAALLVMALWIQRPLPGRRQAAQQNGIVLEATGNGIGLQEGGQRLILMHPGAKEVTYSVGAQGSMRARYVDAESGYVMINNVYVQ